MRTIVVGISDMKASNNPEDVLITYSLGSCLGLILYDPIAQVAGMLHCMLPLSAIDPQKARQTPCMFVDTGVPLLFREVYALGAQKQRIIVKAVGCSSLLDEKEFFRIGERNFTVLRKLLWKNNILIEKQDIGGNISRTVSIAVETGRVIVKSGGRETEL
ncbi:MAG: chemotaxis protein CheD [Desulfobacterota bacterium]|nr:chemotaxis protein CheD [Thermodesulfobacteriota bacterium]